MLTTHMCLRLIGGEFSNVFGNIKKILKFKGGNKIQAAKPFHKKQEIIPQSCSQIR